MDDVKSETSDPVYEDDFEPTDDGDDSITFFLERKYQHVIEQKRILSQPVVAAALGTLLSCHFPIS